jgi:hypothetical protein
MSGRSSLVALVLALGLGAGVAIATTTRTTYVEPSLPILGFAVACAAAAMWVPERWRAPAVILGAFACAAGAGHVLLAPGCPRVHDLQHLWGIWAYGRAVKTGSILPPWIPYIGAGIPLLPFYGPLSFLLALPGILAGLAPVTAWKLALFQSHLLSTVALLAGARLLGVGWRSALVGAVALAFAPWRLTVFDYRGALGEANAYLFLPLAAAAALRSVTAPTRAARTILAISVAALACTHLQSLLTLGIVLAPVLVVASIEPKKLGTTALAAALGLGIAAWAWLPTMLELRYTSVDASTRDNPYYRYVEQGVAPHALFVRERWDRPRFSLPESLRAREHLEGEQMPFYVGAVLVTSALTLAFVGRDRHARAVAVGLLFALGLATAWLAGLGSWVPGLATLRFPWRFLSPAAVLAALALALGFDAWSRGRSQRTIALMGLALVIGIAWDGAPYTGAADRIPPYEGARHWYASDPRIAHWAEQMRPVPLDLPQDGLPRRVYNLELPPNDYRTSIDWFFPGYYEWLNPTVFQEYWKTNDSRKLAEAGVALAFANTSPSTRTIAARPYAELESAGQPIGSAELVSRLPGRIEVRTSVPDPGATLVVREQSFPGWRARIDGQTTTEPKERRGFLAVDLAAGTHDVVLRYGYGTWPRRLGIALTLCGLAGLIGTYRKRSGRPT